MSPHISYVYPSLSQFHRKTTAQRGGLSERWELAQQTGCTYIEVPGTMIKNKTEEELTGLEIGDFLSQKDIELLYSKQENLPPNLKYVLHTEPSLSKANRYGRKIQPEIKWYDRDWTQRHVNMIIAICSYLSRPAEIIEIHPGYKKNTYSDIVNSVVQLLESYSEAFHFYPLILLENRTEQFISRGTDIKEFWEYTLEKYPELEQNFGIVLDVQQLKSRTEDNFLKEYDKIPLDSLKGFHIHTLHRRPLHSDSIQWRYVFGRIREIEKDIIINPEIHQQNKVEQTIKFCEKLLNENS